jgi:hypothetical protein
MSGEDPEAEISLICGSQSFSAKKALLKEKFCLFADNVELLGRDSYRVESDASIEVFRDFLNCSAYGTPITISGTNARSILELCREFGFEALRPECDRILRANPNPNPSPNFDPSAFLVLPTSTDTDADNPKPCQ